MNSNKKNELNKMCTQTDDKSCDDKLKTRTFLKMTATMHKAYQ